MGIQLEMADAEKIAITKQQQQEIANMYKKLANTAGTEASKIANSIGVSDQIKYTYLTALNKRLNKEVDGIMNKIGATTKKNMADVGDAVVGASEKFMQDAGMLFVKGAFSHIPTDIVESLVAGKIYKGDWDFSKALWQSGNKVKADMYKVVATGVAGQKPTIEIAKDLEKYLNPSAAKPWDWKKVYPGVSTKVDYSAQRLARTLVQHAYQLNLTQAVKYNPFVTGIRWHSAMIHGRTCELCKERDEQLYPKDELPFDHPNGLCYFTSEIPNSPEEVADRIADWYKGNPDPHLDLYALKGMGAKAPAGSILVAMNNIKALEAGKKLAKTPLENLLAKEAAEQVAKQKAAQELAEKLAKEAEEAAVKEAEKKAFALKMQEAKAAKKAQKEAEALAKKAAEEAAKKAEEEAKKLALLNKKLPIYKWSIKDKAYLADEYTLAEMKALPENKKLDFLASSMGKTKLEIKGQYTTKFYDDLIDDIYAKKDASMFSPPEVFNVKEAQAILDNLANDPLAVFKFAQAKGFQGGDTAGAKAYLEKLIKQKTKTPKTKVVKFNAEQNKWLDGKGYTPTNLPKDFSEWSHKLTSAEKTDLFDMLDLHGKPNPFQKIQAWYDKNIVTEDLLKANAPKPLTAAQVKQMAKDAYSNLRKDNALWAKTTREADDVLRSVSGKVWQGATTREKTYIYEYTQSYSKYNEPLRGYIYGTSKYVGIGKVDLDDIGVSYRGYAKGQVRKEIDDITSIINKSSYDRDIWLQRGVREDGMDKFFGINLSDFNGSEDNLKSKIMDKVVTDGGFFSMGVAKGTGFSSKPIILNVYAPKGTKMIYAEPFSAYGAELHSSGKFGKKWNGIDKQTGFGSESEMIMQRGTSFRVTKVEKNGGRWYIDVEVVAQQEFK